MENSVRSPFQWVYFVTIFFLAGGIFFQSPDWETWKGFPLDDAWIHRVYAKAFAFGNGFQYNPGMPATGETSPLWAVVSSPLHWFEGNSPKRIPTLTKALCIFLGLMIVLSVCLLESEIGHSSVSIGFGLSLFCLNPRFVFSLLSGMEVPLTVLLCVFSTYQIVKKRFRVGAFCWGLAALSRPEVLLTWPVFFSGLVFSQRKSSELAISGLISFFPQFSWMSYCYLVSGHFLPSTFYVKASQAGSFDLILSAARSGLFSNGMFPFRVIVTLMVFRLLEIFFRKEDCIIASLDASAMVFLFGVVASRKINFEGYYWTRWLDPPLHIISLSLSLMIGRWLTKPFSSETCSKRDVGLAILAFLTVVASVPTIYENFLHCRYHLKSDTENITELNVVPGNWINQNVPLNHKVGVNDAGAMRYLGNRFTIDLIGLNYPDIAFKKKRIDRILAELDWLVVFSNKIKGSIFQDLFDQVSTFSIPLENYSISNSRNQHIVGIYKRKEDWKDLFRALVNRKKL